MVRKTRLDAALVNRGLISGRDRAKRLIMAGGVYVNHQKADKPGMDVAETDAIEVRADASPYVSRGGFKLEKALKVFSLDLNGKICADIGASTGGFTDCMLQNGAGKVYAVDVGYGQLAWKLRTDGRVICLERTNIRHVTEKEIPETLDFVSADVSFISLKLVLPVIARLLRGHGEAVCLVKPQFEAGRESVGKKGVVRDKGTHVAVLRRALIHAEENGLTPKGLTFSPVRGAEGNIEYLMCLEKGGPPVRSELPSPETVVDSAHSDLAKTGRSPRSESL